MKIVTSIVLILLGIFSFSFVQAQTRANTVTFTAAAGYEYFTSRRKMENVSYPIVALGYNFTESWGVEALLGVFRTNFKKFVPDRRQVKGALFSFDGIYHFFPCYFFEPFIEAGVGVTGLNPNRFDGTNEANINAGIGAFMFANPVVAFRVEARDFYTFVGGKNDIVLDAGVTFSLDLC